MDTTNTKVGKTLEVNLSNSFYFKGRCIDEDFTKLVILDKNGDRVEISKSSIILCREVHNA